MITPHFEHTGWLTDTDWDGFATDLCAAMNTYVGSTRETRVKLYDAQGTEPVYPVANKVLDIGQAPASGWPREIALCLSYYSGQNVPRRRGRLYVPCAAVGMTSIEGIPAAGHMTKVMDLATLLKNAGGADVDWVVFSRLDNDARPVSNYWCDNEWDTVRSRGLRATTRQTGTASE